MAGWGRRKDGQPYRKRSTRRISSSDLSIEPPDPTKKPNQPFYSSRRVVHPHRFESDKINEIIRQKNEKWAKKITSEIPEEHQEYFKSAVYFLKPAIPFIASIDPTIGTIYGGYKFAKFGYNFASKVYQEAKLTGDFEKALWNIGKMEVDEKITSKLQVLTIKKSSEYVGKRLWAEYKKKYPNEYISEKLDKHGENALIHTFEEIGGMIS